MLLRPPEGMALGEQMAGNPLYASSEWRRLTAELKATRDPVCHLCNRPIDMDLPSTAKWGCVVDHIVPVSRGGAPLSPFNAALAHRFCNGSKGAGRDRTPAKPETSRDW